MSINDKIRKVNGHEREKYICVRICREDNRHSDQRWLAQACRVIGVGLQVVRFDRMENAPGSFAPSRAWQQGR